MIASALLPLVLAAAPISDPDRAGDTARKILADDKYAFCHDAEYPLTSFEADWCPPVAPSPNPRCPQFHAACNAPRARLDDLDRFNSGRGVAGSGPADGGRGEADRTSEPRPAKGGAGSPASGGPGKVGGQRKTPDRSRIEGDSGFEMPQLGGFAYVLFWVVLGAGLLLLVYVIIKNSTRDRPDEDEAPRPGEVPGAPALPEGPGEQVVRDVNILLDQARASAGAGDYAAAIRLTHAALLHRLDHDGLIRVSPSRTNGDYVADLKIKPELRGSVREIVRDVEQVQFGTTPPDAGLFDRIIKRVLPIATRRVDTLALLLGSALLSCTCAPIKTYPYDLSPSGTRAVIELAEAHGRSLAYRTQPLADVDLEQRGRTLVLLHDAQVDAETWETLLRWTDVGNHLVVAGLTPPAPYDLAITSEAVGHKLAVAGPALPAYGELELVDADRAALLGDLGDGEPLLTREGGQPYAVRYARSFSSGTVTLFADDRLFTNGALMLADNPKFIARFLTSGGDGPVELVDGMLDFGAETPAETIENTHLTAAVLQLLALIALFYLWRGVRFGAPRDPMGRSRRSYSEHVEAVGQHYARARASRHAARVYATWALDRLRDRTLTARQPGLYALAQAIAGRTGDDEARVMQLLLEAQAARDDADASTARPARGRGHAVADDLRLMQELARYVRATSSNHPAGPR
ncbi:MAG: DUF4350 domain-containing protein [Myxococcales bacterium]|nr:DUF4350 domain-containing protein [Myxococcales bacterium]